MFGVCRGKLSEGFDFADEFSRALILVGIPFQNIKDPKLVLKQEYFQTPHQRQTFLVDETMKEVNQVIGRCIRNINDYAQIFLVDERWTKDFSVFSWRFSKWISKSIQVNKSSKSKKELTDSLTSFLETNQKRMGNVRKQNRI